MNNRGFVNADRISQLPEALILEILCLLPTKLAIATSVLSKQWQSYWKMICLTSSLIFHVTYLNPKSLLSHKAPVLQSYHLLVRLYGFESAVAIGILIGNALTRNVRELVLDFYCSKGSFKIPRSLYNCETLETLKLRFDVVIDLPYSVYLKSLRTLHLYWVAFKDDKLLLYLLSGCPNLEGFLVHRNPHCSVKTFTIAAPSLQRLSIYNNYVGQENWGYVINTPSLKFLEINGLRGVNQSFVTENLPELVGASISSNVSETLFNEKLLVSLTSVKRLSLALSPLDFEFPTGSIFHQLLSLELYTYKREWWNLLTLMLDSCPKLQVLRRIGCGNYLVAGGEWNQPKNVPECLLFHLEIFMWEGYKWSRKEDRAVTKYILKNTNRLKRATFPLKHVSSKERIEVVKDLKSVVKATNSSCQVKFCFDE